jgi:hypothetical protein
MILAEELSSSLSALHWKSRWYKMPGSPVHSGAEDPQFLLQQRAT